MWWLGRQAFLLGYDNRFFVMAFIATMAGSALYLLCPFFTKFDLKDFIFCFLFMS